MNPLERVSPHSAVPPSQLEARDLATAAWACRFENRAQSRQLALQALELSPEGHALGLALRARAFCDYIDSAYESALQGFTTALEIARDVRDQILERDCLNFIGAVYQRLGDFTAAIEYTRQAFEVNLELHDEPAIVYSLNNFAMLHREIGESRESVRLFEDALERARQMNDPPRLVTLIANLGETLNTLERSAEAVPLLLEGLQIARDHGLEMLKAPTLVNLAEALTQLGELEQALIYYQQALQLVIQQGPPEGEIHCQLGMARIKLRQGQIASAVSNSQSALESAERLKLQQTSSEAHEVLTNAYKAQGSYQKALHHFEIYHALKQQRTEEIAEQRLRVVNAQFEVRRARSETEDQRSRNLELSNALSRLEQLNADKSDLLQQLEVKTRELERLAFIDPLTGLANRRQLEAALSSAFEAAQSASQPLALAMMDIDDFKDINDRFTHQIGDEVLVQVAGLIRDSLRVTDLASRYGGEEFLVVLPNTTDAQAFEICEGLRARVERFDWSIIKAGLSVTLSIGACTNRLVHLPKQMIATADANMYAAKRSGKNGVVMNSR